MNKQHPHAQPFAKPPKPQPKQHIKSLRPKLAKNSTTPLIHPLFRQGQSDVDRGIYSDPLSPRSRPTAFRSAQASPFGFTESEVAKLIRTSLKKFKTKKKELEKVKKKATDWKVLRKKKLEEYNLHTRAENKTRCKFETFRPKTAWGSPEIKERLSENKHVCGKKAGFSSTERRANIGLEFYNFKTLRNHTPKALLQETNREVSENNRNASKKANVDRLQKNKEIIQFIEKKKKERIRREKKLREKEEEEEFKRLRRLIKVDQEAKKLRKKLHKPSKQKTSLKPPKPKLPRSHSRKNLHQPNKHSKSLSKSVVYTEDEEVLNILQVRGFDPQNISVREGRECLIFGNFSNQFPTDANATEIANKILGKRLKREDPSLIISSSMPIIELKSISKDSSSSSISSASSPSPRPKLNNYINIANSLSSISHNASGLNIDIGLHKLVSTFNCRICLAFELIKIQKLNKMLPSSDELSEYTRQKLSMSQEKPLNNNKKELGEKLLKLVELKQSRESSEDMEKIWDKIDMNTKNVEFLQDPEPLLPLTPFNEEKCSAKPSAKPSSDLSASMIDQLKKVQFPSAEYLSFGNIGEVTHEDLIDSPSLMSIASHSSAEFETEQLHFFYCNLPAAPLIPQSEPAKPYIKPQMPAPILIEDGSVSLSDYAAAVKESSSIATPEAEEIEEFSSINFEFNLKKPENLHQEVSLNPFEETLVLDEDETIEKVLNCLIQGLYTEWILLKVSEDHKERYFKLVGNAVVTLHEISVKTGLSSVLSFIEKIINHVANDYDGFMQHFTDNSHIRIKLALVKDISEEFPLTVLEESVLLAVETPSDLSISLSLVEIPSEFCRIHNRMLFDHINHLLAGLKESLVPPPWRPGKINSIPITASAIFQCIQSETKKACETNAGKIPSIAMLKQDGTIDEEILQTFRENALKKWISDEIEGLEEGWVNYEFEEIQVVVEVAKEIMEGMIEEITEIVG